MVTYGSADQAVDELIQLLQRSMSDISELGSTRGDERLITACLQQIQVVVVVVVVAFVVV